LNRNIYTLLIFILFIKVCHSQVIQTGNGKIKASFNREHIPIDPSSSFFNVLKVTNHSQQSYSFKVDYSIPHSWSVFKGYDQNITLNSGDSVLIPVRVSVSKNLLGGIAYVMSAKLISENDVILDEAFCYLKTPKKQDLKVIFLNSIEYFDKSTSSVCFRIRVKNRGNVNEEVNFDFHLRDALTMPGSEDNHLLRSYNIPAHTDTTVEFTVYKDFENDQYSKPLQMINIKAGTLDTTFQRTVWVKTTENSYTNVINEARLPLIIELTARDILGFNNPSFRADIQGIILLKQDRDVFYGYRNVGDIREKFLTNSWIYAGYRDKKLNVRVGNLVSSRIGQNFSGKGIDVGYAINKQHHVGVMASSTIVLPIHNIGAKYNYYAGNYSINSGVAYSQDRYRHIDSKLGSLGAKFNLQTKHRFFTNLFVSQAKHYTDSTYFKNGLGYIFNYTGRFDKLSVDVKNYYGSREYTGVYGGQFSLGSSLQYKLDNISNISANYMNNRVFPARYYGDSLLPDMLNVIDQLVLTYATNRFPKLYLYGGTILNNYSSNNYYLTEDEDQFFSTSTAKIHLGLRWRGENRYTSLGGKINFGFTNVNKYMPYFWGTEVNSIPAFTVGSAGLSFYHRYWKIFLNYYYGPYSYYQQYSYFYTRLFPKSFRIMPQYEKFIYKDILMLQIYSYYYNSNINIERYGLNAQIFCYLKSGWTFRLLNSLFYSNRFDNGTGEKFSYKANYMEFGVRKAFGWQQPRQKYYNLNIVFFRDINSNKAFDDKEPGVKNVLVYFEEQSVEEVEEDVNNPYYTENKTSFNSVELLSDQFGKVTYNKIPEGTYRIIYTPLGDLQKHTFFEENILINVNKNTTVYIPFSVGFKVFGKVILNRDEFSSLGNISIANIKINAKDTSGNNFSTLTNDAGEFILFIPYAGKYKVSVNNIFYKNFDIRQKSYDIDFDGYKQFEISFIFDEKRREIKFSGDSINKPFDNSNLLRSPDEFDRKPDEEEGWDDVKKFGEEDKSDKETGTEPTRELTEEELNELDRIDRILDGEDPTYFETTEVETEVDTAPTIKYIEKVLDGGKKPKDEEEGEGILPEEETPVPEDPGREEDQPSEERGEEESTETDGTTTEEPTTTAGETDIAENTVDESTTVTETDIPDDGALDMYVDEDFEMFPISSIKDQGLIFKIQIYSNERERLKVSTLEDIEDVICVKSPGSPDPERGFFYYSKTFTKYEDAEAYKLKLMSGGFYTASVAAFRDGKKITLEEAGVY